MNNQQRVEKDYLRTGILILATLTTGMMAGIFLHWTNTIMPGLSNLDDRAFVEAYRDLYTAINNPLFVGVQFTGAMLLTGLAVALYLRPEQRPVLIWAGAALACYLVACVVTFGVPLNEQLEVPGGLGANADYAAARDQFDETTWTAWNTVRAVASTLAFGCLLWAIAIHRQYRRVARLPMAQTQSQSAAWAPPDRRP
jgi:uncharacterized membrane protein